MKTRLDPKAIMKSLRRQGFEEMKTDYPFEVDLGSKTTTKDGGREEIRTWFKISFIKVHQAMGEDSDVIWDKNWRRFYFRTSEHQVLFKLRFL